MRGSKTWANLGAAFSFALLFGAHDDATAQAHPPGSFYDQDRPLEELLAQSKPAAGDKTAAGPQDINTLRRQYPGVEFVQMGKLDKTVTLPVDHVAFDRGTKELTVTVRDYSQYENTLRGIFLNPLSSWPSHTVLTFNGFQVNDDSICAFIPNAAVGDVKAVKLRQSAIDGKFNVDWDKSKTAPDRAAGEGLSIQQKVTITSTTLPTQLFDASKLTCVAVEMPRAGMLWNLATADNGRWVTLRSGATNAGDPSANDPPQPTQ